MPIGRVEFNYNTELQLLLDKNCHYNYNTEHSFFILFYIVQNLNYSAH